MQVKSIEPVEISYTEVVLEDGSVYERYSADNWRWVIGESTETVFTKLESLEAAYQEYKNG